VFEVVRDGRFGLDRARDRERIRKLDVLLLVV
jgi:hypothetical protein